MEGVNQFLASKSGQEAIKFSGKENHMQGLYFDLLSCLAGGDHPSLPQGYQQKPMTGFLDIVEAFNDVAKLHNAGSGIVFEVGSKESVEEGVLTSGSRETWDVRNSGESSTNSQSLQSFLCDDDSQRQSSATSSNQSAETNMSCNDLRGGQLNSNSSTSVAPGNDIIIGEYSQMEETHNDIEKEKSLDENDNGGFDTYVDAKDTLEKVQDRNDNQEQINNPLPALCLENTLKHNKETDPADTAYSVNSVYVKEVGAPLELSDSSLFRSEQKDISRMEKEMLKYSEELKEIERMLKLHLSSPLSLSGCRTEPPAPTFPSSSYIPRNNGGEESDRPTELPIGMVQTLADGLVSPSCALELMYDMESNDSLYNAQSPHESAYESCTSFETWQSQGPRQNVNLIGRTPSVYLECLNVNDNENSDFTQHTTNLNSISSALLSDKKTYREVQHSRLRENDNHLLSEMVNQFTATKKNSHKDDSDEEPERKDAQFIITATTPEKPKIAFTKSPVSSEEDEHLWTSASGSESEDYEDIDIRS